MPVNYYADYYAGVLLGRIHGYKPWLKKIYIKNRQYRIQPRITQESIKTLISTVVPLLRERFKLEIIIKIIYINKCGQILTA